MIFDCKKAFYIETFFCYTTSQYLLHRNETVLMLGSTVQLCLLCNIHTSRNFIIVVSFSYSQPIKLQPQFIAWYCNLVELLETWYHIHDQEIQPNLTSKIFSQKTQQTINIRFKKKINTPATLQKKKFPPAFPCFFGVAPFLQKRRPRTHPVFVSGGWRFDVSLLLPLLGGWLPEPQRSPRKAPTTWAPKWWFSKGNGTRSFKEIWVGEIL